MRELYNRERLKMGLKSYTDADFKEGKTPFIRKDLDVAFLTELVDK